MIYYCSSTGGFYEDAINKKSIPDDKIQITPAYRLELLDGQRAGKCIVADKTGYPTLADVQPPTEEKLRASALATRDELVKEASTRIGTLQDAVDLGEATSDEEAVLIEWKRYRIALMRMEQEPGFALMFDWPVRPGTQEQKVT